MRKLVTIRQISDIQPIAKADAIELAKVDGWQVVVKKGEYKPGDFAVYCEIDSFLPAGNPAWAFLKADKTFENVVGHKLRTIKLRGELSQGLLLTLDSLPEIKKAFEEDSASAMDKDWAEALSILKYEAPQLAGGDAAGTFPSNIPKTDQERVQNVGKKVFGYECTRRYIPVEAKDIVQEAIGERLFIDEEGKVYCLNPPLASQDDLYEATIKMDGSSITAGVMQNFDGPETIVCSRNLKLKLDTESTFVQTAQKVGLLDAINAICTEYSAEHGKPIGIVVQGELMGPGIQGNRENFSTYKIFVFDILVELGNNNGQFKKLKPDERAEMFARIKNFCTDDLRHCPILHRKVKLKDIGITDVQSALKFAERPSVNNPVAEGVVFKKEDDADFSFKAISNTYLLGEKD